MKIKVILYLLIAAIMLPGIVAKGTSAYLVDTETSVNNYEEAWVSQEWLQTTQQDFEAGVLNNVDTSTNPGGALLSLVPNPTLVTSDNGEVATTTSDWHLVKTLTFNKSGSSYNNLRIDSNLKVSDSSYTIYSSIRVDDVEQFSHSTTSTTYVSYSDATDFSSYPDGEHTIKLYLQVDGGTGYNSTFELYRTTTTLITSDNSEVSATGDTNWHLVKTLTFNKSGSSSNNLRIDSNLKATNTATASSSIRVDDVEQFSHSTTSTAYVSYSDVIDFSSYPDGEHTVKLYLKTSKKQKAAYNSVFELYSTSPTLITSDNTEVFVTSDSAWQLLKVLTFTKDGATYDELRIDSNLKATNTATAYSSIRVDDVEQFSHSTTSTTYVIYSDVTDISGHPDGQHTVKLYLRTSKGNKEAYNSTFELYRTKTYPSSGTVASQVLDTATAGGRWDGLGWEETLESGTDITFEVRASDTAFLKGNATPSWTSVTGDSIIETGLPAGRYKQWQATLTTTDQDLAETPILQAVTVYYHYRP